MGYELMEVEMVFDDFFITQDPQRRSQKWLVFCFKCESKIQPRRVFILFCFSSQDLRYSDSVD